MRDINTRINTNNFDMKFGYPEIYKPAPVVPDLFPNEGNTLFILGNGLDVDLGFPTKYKDYFESNFFPFVHNDHSCHALGHFVYEKGIQEKWYDLENILAEFGAGIGEMSEDDIAGNKDDYKKLVQGLSAYLKSVNYKEPRMDSVAANILRAADDRLLPPTVYTFNYTDFEVIANALEIGYSDAHHIHGSLKENDIVLGVGEYVKLGPNASYLHKTSSLNYNSDGILNAFESFPNIIIFGLSLSQVDYPYFEDFFKDVASREYMGDHKKFIRIFTRNEKSRLEILDNLRGMNSGLIKLRGYSDFDIIRTENDIDDSKVQEVIRHLSVRAKVDV